MENAPTRLQGCMHPGSFLKISALAHVVDGADIGRLPSASWAAGRGPLTAAGRDLQRFGVLMRPVFNRANRIRPPIATTPPTAPPTMTPTGGEAEFFARRRDKREGGKKQNEHHRQHQATNVAVGCEQISWVSDGPGLVRMGPAI